MSQHAYPQEQIDAVYRAIYERRDVRHFVAGEIEEKTLKRLLAAAHQAPSVGFMQPWRFIRITSHDTRQAIHALVEKERVATAEAMGERSDEFMRLKVEGILECSEVLVVALADRREEHVFGRRTMPEMDLSSVSCAIQNIWLAARAEGLGMGWVSLFEPSELATLLKMPEGSQPVAVLCLGHVDAFYDKPMLSIENWAHRRDLDELVMENQWQELADHQDQPD
ncbi:5,6-dimethylbenzimidazole synthase [Pleionea sp. CnH1-48]|uniref:5,6-dimethylbenzimidazole synthase n=1 Tax=Pleionea sp. CnH1-48 TaxID=2954494 RepID=UPI00209835B4|nr:5,6-dimethylbenzimidazole synthase [Pleionea sp. CnH1-48]MCO7223536.1 5,6-dimethylbenzimidazole synthase [Pleionea sp. CnH1-48]